MTQLSVQQQEILRVVHKQFFQFITASMNRGRRKFRVKFDGQPITGHCDCFTPCIGCGPRKKTATVTHLPL
jgi:hypothetical protein